MVSAAHAAVTPAGRPIGVPMPVAPVVVCVIDAVRAVLMQSVGVDEAAPAAGMTCITKIYKVALAQAFGVWSSHIVYGYETGP